MTIWPEAEADLAGAYAWYEHQRPSLGADFLLCVEEVLERVERTPQLYRIVHRGVRRALTRRFPYAIYYRQDPNDVVVLAVQHASRDPERWQSRV